MIDSHDHGGRDACGIALKEVPDCRAALTRIRKVAIVPPSLRIIRRSTAGQEQVHIEEAWT